MQVGFCRKRSMQTGQNSFNIWPILIADLFSIFFCIFRHMMQAKRSVRSRRTAQKTATAAHRFFRDSRWLEIWKTTIVPLGDRTEGARLTDSVVVVSGCLQGCPKSGTRQQQ
jgi:hypothetical protein